MKRRFRSRLWVIRQYLATAWAQLQYYKYEPSKPSKAEFLKLSTEEQQAWIEGNIPEYEFKLFGDNYLC